MRHRFLKAAAVLAVAIALSGLALGQPAGVRWRVDTAVYYIGNGWLPEALEHLQQAVRMAPDDAEAYLLMGMIFDVSGDAERALAAYGHALALAPDAAPLDVLMGDIYFAAGRLDEARRAYEQALARFPDAGTAYYGLARVQAAGGSDAAVDTLRTAVEHAPDLIDARLLLGRILRLSGRPEEALEHLLHAQRLDRNRTDVRLELALVYEALERMAEAEHEYRMVLRLDPGNEEAGAGLRRLLEVQQANT